MAEIKKTATEITQDYALRHPVLSLKDIDSVSGNMVLNRFIPHSKLKVVRLTTAVIIENFTNIHWYFVGSICYTNGKAIPLKFLGNKEKKLIKKELLRIAGNAGDGDTIFAQSGQMIWLERKLNLQELEILVSVTEEMAQKLEGSNAK